jgi:hypothetical protein
VIRAGAECISVEVRGGDGADLRALAGEVADAARAAGVRVVAEPASGESS